MNLSTAAKSLLAMAFLAGVAGRAAATTTLDLGTAANALGWTGSACGATVAAVAQSGPGIALSGAAASQCRVAASWLASEVFQLPADATGIVLRIGDFSAGGAMLRLNGHPLLLSGGPGASVTEFFLPGAQNRLDILIAGATGIVSLAAGLDYAVPAAAPIGNAAPADAPGAAVPEPAAWGLFAPALLAVAVLWRGPRRRPLRGSYSAAARRAAPSIANM